MRKHKVKMNTIKKKIEHLEAEIIKPIIRAQKITTCEKHVRKHFTDRYFVPILFLIGLIVMIGLLI